MSYKYIISVNGIVWDSIKASNIKEAKQKATRWVRATFRRMPNTRRLYGKVPLTVEVETVRKFLGK